MSSMSRLVVVSNRLPFTLTKDPEQGEPTNQRPALPGLNNEIAGCLRRQASAGGLVTAVAPVVIQSEGVWVGWPGAEVDIGADIPDSDPADVSPTAGLRSSQVVPVHLNNEVKYFKSIFFVFTSITRTINCITMVVAMQHFGLCFTQCRTELSLMKTIGWPIGGSMIYLPRRVSKP